MSTVCYVGPGLIALRVQVNPGDEVRWVKQGDAAKQSKGRENEQLLNLADGLSHEKTTAPPGVTSTTTTTTTMPSK